MKYFTYCQNREKLELFFFHIDIYKIYDLPSSESSKKEVLRDRLGG